MEQCKGWKMGVGKLCVTIDMLCSQADVRSYMVPCAKQVVVAAAAADLNQSKLVAELGRQRASWPGAVGDPEASQVKVVVKHRPRQRQHGGWMTHAGSMPARRPLGTCLVSQLGSLPGR